jgi:hypothetical protein
MLEILMIKSKIIIFVTLLGFVVSGCGFWGIRGNGRVKDETRTIEDFQRIQAGGAFTIKINVGQPTTLKISAEDNLLGYIKTNVKGNTLIIDTRKNISPRKEILIEITTPELVVVDASGANNITVHGIKGTHFNVDLSGAGNISLSGVVEKFNAELSGAGNINAKELKAKVVHVSVSGAASADVYAKESLDASVSGVGSIDYYGNPPDTKTNVSGVGSISRK